MNRNHKILLITLIIIFVILNITLIFKKNSNMEQKNYDKKLDINNNLAIMIEKEDKTGYEESINNKWPSKESYKFNNEKSGCIDIEGNVLENILTYNEITETVELNTSITTYCYLYFDKKEDIQELTGNSVVINSNAEYTTSTNVTLILQSTGASEMCISESESCSNWETYTTSKSYTLSNTLGTKTIYVKYRDEAGNVSETVNDTINLYEEVNVPNQSGSLIYTGSSQSPKWSNYDSSKLTIGGTTSGTNAESYSATFTPKTNYIWSDGSTTAKTISWSIGKAAGSLSVSPASLTINVGKTGQITVTRAGNGTVSAESNNTSVATVSVSGTTITVTGKSGGTATITVSVAAGTNHNVPTNKTVSVTVSPPPAGKYIQSLKPTGLNTTMEGGLYRFQGTTANNYICFGTSTKATCTGNTDAYMYRIIGINSSGQLKLIKKEALNTTYAWYVTDKSSTTNILWPNSDLFKGLNGISGGTYSNLFIGNSTYMPSGWSDKIADTSWKYGANNKISTALALYTTENAWTNTVTAKIGLMYAHDYAYGMPGGYNCSQSGGQYPTCKTSWVYLTNSDPGASRQYEWTMSYYGSSYGIYQTWIVNTNGYFGEHSLSTPNAVRPVFYLKSSVNFIGGTGTLEDPFIIS